VEFNKQGINVALAEVLKVATRARVSGAGAFVLEVTGRHADNKIGGGVINRGLVDLGERIKRFGREGAREGSDKGGVVKRGHGHDRALGRPGRGNAEIWARTEVAQERGKGA
jgi:hypothetical protein